ncbi:MAG: hypothetical protein HOL75_09550 [Nitrospina sp.]|jgi:hypothetical protein|nr:hypothetical protein [Nitrospina sp.]
MKFLRIMNTLLSSVRLVKQIARLKGLWFKFVLSAGILVALGIVTIYYMGINLEDIFSLWSKP